MPTQDVNGALHDEGDGRFVSGGGSSGVPAKHPESDSRSKDNAGLYDLDGLDNHGREFIRGEAERFARMLEAKGFEAHVVHSGSAAGPSSYVNVLDPQTGIRTRDPFRISGHSKGVFNSQFVNNVAGDNDFQGVLDKFLKAREKIKSSPSFIPPEELERRVKARMKEERSAKEVRVKEGRRRAALEFIKSGRPLTPNQQKLVDWYHSEVEKGGLRADSGVDAVRSDDDDPGQSLWIEDWATETDPVSRPQAAGTMIVADGKMLFIRRSQGNDHPGQWCLPGGMVEAGETLEDAARRETREETGFTPDALTEVATLHEDDTDFTVFFTQTQPFDVTLNLESDGAKWLPLGQAPEPLLGATRQFLDSPPFLAIRKKSMTEIDVARAIMSGEMTSPQQFETMWLFALRITGTGMAWRNRVGEMVYREPSAFLNDDFLERCNGLPVILEHPDKLLLTPEEFKRRIAGTTFMPFIATAKVNDDGQVRAIADEHGDEVWAIAKIYNRAAAYALMENQFSTSPGVRIRQENGTVVLDNGATLLVEGNPLLLDHIAIVASGVWDKDGEPSGVSVNNEEGTIMADSAEVTNKEVTPASTSTEINKPVADAAVNTDPPKDDAEKRADAAAKEYEEMRDRLDSLAKRIDSMEGERGKKADAGTKKADADEDTDAEVKAKEAEAARIKSEAKTLDAANAAAQTRSDGDDADKEDLKGKLKEALERADSAERVNSDILKRVNELEQNMVSVGRLTPKPLTDEDYAQMARAQARADSVYGAFGRQAPRAMNGEDLLAYRKRLASPMKKHSKTWKDVDFSKFDAAAFDVAESQVYADAAEEARHPTDIEDGSLREVTKQVNGHQITEFYGSSPYAWMGLFRTPRMKSRLSRPGVAAPA